MSPEQNTIMSYFIEDTNEPLNTVDRGLLHLTITVADAKRISEVFRAAREITGLVAIPGIHSIEPIARELENCFKRLKHVPVKGDRTPKSLWSQGFDCTNRLFVNLSKPGGLSDRILAKMSFKAESILPKPIAHLDALPRQSLTLTHFYTTLAKKPSARAAPGSLSADCVPASHPTLEPDSTLQLIFKSDIPKLLQNMLDAFQQPDGDRRRQQLVELCRNWRQLGKVFELQEWNHLIQTITSACHNLDRIILSILSRSRSSNKLDNLG